MEVVTRYSFRLFVNGQTERSSTVEVNLRALCESRLPGGFDLEVIDTAEQPGLAEEQRILATPTAIRLAPLPQRRVIGDLSDQRRTAYALGLPERSGPTRQREEE